MTDHRTARTASRWGRLTLAAGAATALLLGTAGSAMALQGPATTNEQSVLGGLEVIEVQPYEPLDIAENWQLGMLPEGDQNYVVSPADSFDDSIEAAKGYPGDQLRPDTISLGVSSQDDDVKLITGAWRTAETPSEIIVDADPDWGYAAQLVELEGDDGWGAFYLDADGIELPESFTVTAYDEDGNAFDQVEFTPWAWDN